MKICYGTTRISILIGKLCFKIPTVCEGWENFLRGILGNLQEKQFERCIKPFSPPIYFSLKGLINVTARCHVQDASEYNPDRFKYLDEYYLEKKKPEYKNIAPVLDNIVENKIDSIGKLNGRIVVVDYGS